MDKFFFYFRLGLWLSLTIFVVWLLVRMAVPAGYAVYQSDQSKASDFIGPWEPADRLVQTDGRVVIEGDLVYLNLRTTRPFDRLKLTVQYRPENAALIEVGLLRDEKKWLYNLRPLYNKLLNNLYYSEKWGVLQEGEAILLQRQENYDSFQDFLHQPPAASALAVYYYELPNRQSRKIDAAFLPNEKINYIAAAYRLPKILANGLWESEVEFDLRGAPRQAGAYKIMINTPTLKNSVSAKNSITIEAVKAEYFGQAWQSLFKLSNE